MSKSAVIISVNVIGTDGKLVNPGDPTGAPFLCYCNDISEADDLIMKSDRFREFINNNILIVENYSQSRVAFCWYVDGQYNSRCVEVEKWIPLSEAGDLDMRFLKSICDNLLIRAEIEEARSEDGDVIDETYRLIAEKYPGRFSRLTMHHYISEELKKIDFTEENYLHMINLISKLKKDEGDSEQERSV